MSGNVAKIVATAVHRIKTDVPQGKEDLKSLLKNGAIEEIKERLGEHSDLKNQTEDYQVSFLCQNKMNLTHIGWFKRKLFHSLLYSI